MLQGDDDFAECESPVTYDGLGEDLYEFLVYAVDTAGNQAEPQSYEMAVDRTPPAVGTRDLRVVHLAGARWRSCCRAAGQGVGLVRGQCWSLLPCGARST